MRHLSILAALFASAATPTLALDFGNGFSAEGKIELEYTDIEDSSDETYLFGDVDLSYQSATTGFGGFVGIDSLFADEDDRKVFYGALSYSGDFGKVQIGAPRVALDDYLRAPILSGADFFEFGELGALTGSYLSLIAVVFEETPLGLRYDGTFGPASIGVSYHSIDEGSSSTIDFITAGMNYSLGNTVLIAGLENISAGSTSRTSVFLGAETTLDQFMLGFQYSKPEALASGVDAIEVYGVYSPTDALDFTATYLKLESGSFDTEAYGLSAKYTASYGAFVEAGYGEFSGSGSSSQANLGLGIEF